MMNVRTLTAQVAILSVFQLSLYTEAGRLQADTPRPELRQRVEQFGVGTELKVKLKSGEKLRGPVESIGSDSFVVASREVAFNDLANVSYPKRGYKTNDDMETPDPAAARRMVVQLGVGEHIMVKVSPTEKVRGNIVAIHDDHFSILPDDKPTPLDVPYTTIRKVNKNLSFGATLAILVGIAAAVVLVVVLTGKDEVDVLPN